MTHLAITLFSDPATGPMGMWLFLAVSTVALFAVFIPTVTWIDSRRKEREAFYKAETFRRLAEASGDGAKAALELLREEDRLKRIRSLEGMKIAGIINLCVGVALIIFLRILLGGGAGSPALAGLIPAFVGVAFLVYVYALAAPVK
ncbi:MAG TPA: hypothetical protein VFE01_04115 [Terracidiphilus sp.]|jgi:hypothetical protein|nr:hypothetical protein [Terracidiphilus sp.]